jgi:uncharacterized protein (DUF1697 family)
MYVLKLRTALLRSGSGRAARTYNQDVKYVALLRGINVGGNNPVQMTELRACLESMGLKNVTTYIQSGNILFETPIKTVAKLSRSIEDALSEKLLSNAQVVVVSQHQLESIVANAPPAFGADPSKYRYDVVFIKAPLSAQELLPAIALKQGVDEAFEGNGVLYFKRLVSRASESKLPKLVSSPAYKSLTIRNWNTTTRLRDLMST